MGNIHATMVRCFPMTKRVQSSSWRRQWEATAGGRSNGEVITASKDNVSCQGLSDAKVLILRTHRCCRGCCAPSPEVAPPSPAITDAAAAQGIDRCPFCQNLVRNTIHRAERAGTYFDYGTRTTTKLSQNDRLAEKLLHLLDQRPDSALAVRVKLQVTGIVFVSKTHQQKR